MGDIESLGTRVRGISADLPVTDAREATDRLSTAHTELTDALRESVEPVGRPQLARAMEHMDTARARLKFAAEQLDEYLASIGFSGAATEDASGSAAPAAPVKGAAPGGEDWWRDRVNEISDGDDKTKPSQVSLTTLFSSLVEHARKGERERFRERLLEAGPRLGPRLPGLAWPMIRGLAADVLNRPPAASDSDRLRSLTREPLHKVLPKLPDEVALSQLHGACHLPWSGRGDNDHPHPADAAATGPVIVAALLREREKTRKDT